ncbi:MAG: hypothetical protein AAB649_00255 [Patescibacteria group bacterium]
MNLNRSAVERAFSHFDVEGSTKERLANKLNALMRQSGDLASPNLKAEDVESYLNIQASTGKWVELVGENWRLSPTQVETLQEKEKLPVKVEVPKPMVHMKIEGKVPNVPPLQDKATKPNREKRTVLEDSEARARKEILECEDHPLFPQVLEMGLEEVAGWSGADLFERLSDARLIVRVAEAIKKDTDHPVYASRDAEIARLKKALEVALDEDESDEEVAVKPREEKKRVMRRRNPWGTLLFLVAFLAIGVTSGFVLVRIPEFARVFGIKPNVQQATEKSEEKSEKPKSSLRQALEKYKNSQKQGDSQ